MQIEHENDDDDGVRMISLCRQHSLEMYRSVSANLNTSFVSHTLTLPEMEKIFWLYASVEDIASMLSVSEEVVSDVYEYWKLRRIDNRYKPLLSDRSEVERQVVCRLQSSAASHPERLRQAVRQSFERVIF
ncbi:unnamed protein product [Gongylonema pulchrum]|uniref:HTH luxR-type domain-containing protein n=1 Tax=Gongylonema pulchrum TaxID=637853 RepID=A0A183DBJ4_9BILA|nr:unnamed protein product [Gongylonema pulchrum]